MRSSRVLRLGVLLTALGVASFVLSNAAYFRVHEIRVKESTRVPKEEILALSGLSIGMHIYSFDPRRVEAAICKNPWIHTATVTRSLPGLVSISTSMRQPIAAIPHYSGFFLIDSDARVVDFQDGGQVLYPVITGYDSGNTLAGDFIKHPSVLAGLRCLESLTPEITAQLSEVNVDKEGEVTLFLVGGLRVFIGQADAQTERKARTLESLLEDIRKSSLSALHVDLRYEQPVIRLRD